MKHLWKYVMLLNTLTMVFVAHAQEKKEEVFKDAGILMHSHITVRKIFISGNKITKKYIVQRELQFQEGKAYSISEMLQGIQVSRQNLMNTTLFIDASVFFTNWYNDSLDIQIDLKERWYYIPLPYFKPIDRNWNVWIKEHGMDMDRVNYGVKFLGKNITGRNDRLNAWILNGYTKKVALNYYNPFTDNKLRHGFGFDFAYAENREVNYGTSMNKQVFVKDPARFLKQQHQFGVMYSYRKGSVERHYVRLGMHSETIADTVAKLNPRYFTNGSTHATYPELRYSFQHFNLNYIPYPTRGSSIEFEFTKRGFKKNMNLWQFMLRGSKYIPLPYKSYFATTAEMHLRLPYDQPFYNLAMLGYNESYLRGLEYYVVDGVAGGFVRNTIGREVLSLKWKTGLRSRNYESIPFKFYIKAFADAGYVYSKYPNGATPLTNKFIYTGGFGVDVVSIYDFVLRLECSFNSLGEAGFFVHKPDVR